MVALFMAIMFLLFVGIEWVLSHVGKHRKGVRFYPDLGPCMADGGKPVKKEKK